MAAWFDPLVFAVSCLVGGGALLSLHLGYAAGRRTRATLGVQVVVGLGAAVAGCFALVASAFAQPLAIWGSAAMVLALYLLLVITPAALGADWGATLVRLA